MHHGTTPAATASQASASTSAEVLHLTTLAVSGSGTLADAGVGASTGSVDGGDRPRSAAVGANLSAALADQALPDVLAGQRVAERQAVRQDRPTDSGTA